MRLLLLPLLLAGCVVNQPTDEPTVLADGDRTVEGRITAVDLEPLAYDGDGRILVELEGGGTATVLVPARSNLCEARDIGTYGDARVGDRIEVRGAVVRGGVLPCASGAHYFRVD